MPPSVSRPFTRKSSTLPTKPVKKKKWVDRHSQLKSSPLLQPLMSGSAAGGEGAFQTPGGPGANMSSPVSPARLWATLQALRPGAPPSTGTLGGTGGGDQSVKPLHPGAQGRRPGREPGVGGAAALRPRACRVRGQLSQHQGHRTTPPMPPQFSSIQFSHSVVSTHTQNPSLPFSSAEPAA